jgi:hypothetical protein
MQNHTLDIARVVALLSLIWAAGALGLQLKAARGGARRDYSRPLGDPRRGVRYAFTIAMLPRHKESVRNHPLEFAIGSVMHLGIVFALLGIVAALLRPSAGFAALIWMHPLLLLALMAGVCLCVRRVFSRNLRAMSSPDDFIAILASCGLLAVLSLLSAHRNMPIVALFYAALLLLYLPLGKLRHVAFFFAARADFGRRLGFRGVYPPAAVKAE